MFYKKTVMCRLSRLCIKLPSHQESRRISLLFHPKCSDAVWCKSCRLSAIHSLFNCLSRRLTNFSSDTLMGKPNDMGHFWEQYSKGLSFNKRCVNRVSDALDCSEEKSKRLIGEHPRLFLDEIDSTMEIVDVLLENNIPKVLIRNNVWLLYFSKADLMYRFKAMKRWNVCDSLLRDLIVLLKLPLKDFNKVTSSFVSEKDTIPDRNRVVYLAKQLELHFKSNPDLSLYSFLVLLRTRQEIKTHNALTNYNYECANCSVKAMAERLEKNKYLLVRDIDLITTSINTYCEYGISKNDLLRDTWSLKYTEPVIRRRLNTAKAENIPEMKTWFVRCSDEKFKRILEMQKLEAASLKPFKTREEYLSHRLEIDVGAAKKMMGKQSTLRKTNITKVINVINFLLGAGYKGFHIYSCPRIFSCSIDTIVDRVTELKDFGLETPSLHIILKAETEYRKVLERVIQYSSKREIIGKTGE